MKRITISEVVGEADSSRGPAEICAVAEAAFDEGKSQIIIQLDCGLRLRTGLDELLRDDWLPFREPWLPHREVHRETVAFEDACALTREVFQHWVHKIRQSVPSVSV